MSENEPEITACDATTVARVARPTIGSTPHDGSIAKNGLSIPSAPAWSRKAPCPKYDSRSDGNTTAYQASAIGRRPK